jgi:hypothetical protein
LSVSSPLTCLACEARPVAYATASRALGIMWPHKPHHYIKVGIPSGDLLVTGQLNVCARVECGSQVNFMRTAINTPDVVTAGKINYLNVYSCLLCALLTTHK